jgi:hypothetical protein
MRHLPVRSNLPPTTSFISQPNDPLLHHNLEALCLVFAFNSSMFNHILELTASSPVGSVDEDTRSLIGTSSIQIHSCRQGKAHPW